MAKQFLLIGVGGSGGKTLRYAEREVSRRLSEIGWTQGVPEAWRFLHIDVPSEPDVVEGDVPATVGKTSSYLGLASPSRRYRDYDADLVQRKDSLAHVAGWRPDPNREYAPPYKGAGQRRVVGRVVAASQLSRIAGAINNELRMMESGDAKRQLLELDDLAVTKLGGKLGSENTQEIERGVIVAASLGGGSGSGVFLDILEFLNAEGMGADTMPVLFSTDVFDNLSKEASVGIEPNSLAAVSELLSAFEHEGLVTEGDAEFLDRAGVEMNRRGKRISCVSFFVGRRNNSITYPQSSDVFRSVGKGVSAFMLVPGVAKTYSKYVGNNLSAKPIRAEFPMANPSELKQAASSMGYANVTLGRSLFAAYLSERLAKRSLDTLLRGHRKNTGADDLRKDEDIVNEVVFGDGSEKSLGILAQFYKATGLWEESSDHNDVLDALRDEKEQQKKVTDLAKGVLDDLRARSSSEMSPGSWLEAIQSSFNAAAKEFTEKDRNQRNAKAKQWTADIQVKLKDQTAKFAGTYGFKVTEKLLEELANQLERAAVELEHDGADLEQKQAVDLRSVQHEFGSISEQKITNQHVVFSDAAKLRRLALYRGTEADLHSLAAGLMREIRSEVIPPLKLALTAARKRLEGSEKDNYALMIQQWSDGPVPRHLMPAPNEALLEPVDSFPANAGKVLSEMFETAPQNAEAQAVAEIVSGVWTTSNPKAEPTSLIESLADWQSADSEVRDLAQPASAAKFEISLDIPDILANATSWVQNREKISDYVSLSLARWLNKGDVDAAERGKLFTNSLAQALSSAAPLVNVDASTHRLVCGEDPARPVLLAGDIPMAADHPEYERVKEVLVDGGFKADEVEKMFNPGSPASSVEISTFLSESVHPIVFDSIFEPINEDWQGRQGAGREQFWDFRRSRALPSFIPISSAKQVAMVRGWVAGNLLGQISHEDLSIWTPRGRKSFPSFLLGRGKREPGGLLPALLETLPLAFTSFANGDTEPLDAYRRLLELGASGPVSGTGFGGGRADDGEPLLDSVAFSDSYNIGTELKDWIQSGTLRQPDGGFPEAPTPPVATAGPADGDPSAREDAMKQSLAAASEGLANEMATFADMTPEMTLKVSTRWELHSQMAVATDQLHDAVAKIVGATPDVEASTQGVL